MNRTAPAPSGALLPCPVAFEAIPRETWDRLIAVTPAATPFSRWTFHRAWWDAYGSTAHPQYAVYTAADDPAAGLAPTDGDFAGIKAIVPLMHRHEVEPQDATTATVLRHQDATGTSVSADAKAVFMAASYHADYATFLCAPEDVEPTAAAFVSSCADPAFAGPREHAWDVIDLRRFRAEDPVLPALEAAFRARAEHEGWEVRVEQEDVCPVVDLTSGDWDEYLATLEKKARHEIRRKLRRAEAAGPVRFQLSDLGPAAVDRFIDLHQARWGDEGLFPRTEGGDRSRVFLHHLAELEAAEGARAQLQIGAVSVGGRVIFATVGFDDGRTCFFYNAGMDPEARELSPGVTGTAAYIQDRLEAGRQRFDFLRGSEAYKYEWGARDEAIYRLLVQRTAAG